MTPDGIKRASELLERLQYSQQQLSALEKARSFHIEAGDRGGMDFFAWSASEGDDLFEKIEGLLLAELRREIAETKQALNGLGVAMPGD